MVHGQYLVNSSKSSIFDECLVVFQVLGIEQMLLFFEECTIVFQAPAQFPKIKMSRILLSIRVNFSSGSYIYIYRERERAIIVSFCSLSHFANELKRQ